MENSHKQHVFAPLETKKEQLAIIMPVYNEEGSITTVLEKWETTLEALHINYTIFAYNDGSKDNTSTILKEYAQGHPSVIPYDKPNSGHGPTILKGYREASEKEFSWIFQIDSDDEMGPENFHTLWSIREQYDFLLGLRDGRKQPWSRKIISFISRLSVRLFYGKSVWDVNSPYRLMRTKKFATVYSLIPNNTFAPNVIISGYVGAKKLSYFQHLIPHQDRQTGEVSIKKWKLLKAAMKSFWQTIFFSFKQY